MPQYYKCKQRKPDLEAISNALAAIGFPFTCIAWIKLPFVQAQNGFPNWCGHIMDDRKAMIHSIGSCEIAARAFETDCPIRFFFFAFLALCHNLFYNDKYI